MPTAYSMKIPIKHLSFKPEGVTLLVEGLRNPANSQKYFLSLCVYKWCLSIMLKI